MGKGSMAETRAETVLQVLRRTLAIPAWSKSKNDPFETLIVTILSQNTADRNTARAFENLSKQFEITPEALANAETSQIEATIRSAGLYKNKAKTIQNTSKVLIKDFHGTLKPILSLPLEEARKTLTQFQGIGPKTADVVLLFSARQPTIPVDTHVNRVSKRLGFAPPNANYETVRKNLQHLYKPNDYLAVHVLLIAHGRKYCRAVHPLCTQCPVNMHCPTKGKWT
jgi:endonuclease-3